MYPGLLVTQQEGRSGKEGRGQSRSGLPSMCSPGLRPPEAAGNHLLFRRVTSYERTCFPSRPGSSPVSTRDGTRNAQTPKANVSTSGIIQPVWPTLQKPMPFGASARPHSPLKFPPYRPVFMSGSALQDGAHWGGETMREKDGGRGGHGARKEGERRESRATEQRTPEHPDRQTDKVLILGAGCTFCMRF